MFVFDKHAAEDVYSVLHPRPSATVGIQLGLGPITPFEVNLGASLNVRRYQPDSPAGRKRFERVAQQATRAIDRYVLDHVVRIDVADGLWRDRPRTCRIKVKPGGRPNIGANPPVTMHGTRPELEPIWRGRGREE
jgi:hypothetical protein